LRRKRSSRLRRDLRPDVQDHQTPDALGVGSGEHEGDDAAHGQPHQRHLGQLQGIHEGQQVRGHRADAVSWRPVAVAMPALIQREDAIPTAQRGGGVVPGARVTG
jgi:hypothetical protein